MMMGKFKTILLVALSISLLNCSIIGAAYKHREMQETGSYRDNQLELCQDYMTLPIVDTFGIMFTSLRVAEGKNPGRDTSYDLASFAMATFIISSIIGWAELADCLSRK